MVALFTLSMKAKQMLNSKYDVLFVYFVKAVKHNDII
jgi:hypothetical protein